MTLYEIDANLFAILENVTEDGEIPEELFAELDELQMMRNAKIENIALFVKNLTADAEAIKAEKLMLEDRQRAKLRKAESLKQYLEYALSGQKFESPRVVVSWRKSQAVVLTDESQIPVQYLEPQAPKIIKTEISKALKAGGEVPGAVLETRQNLQIK